MAGNIYSVGQVNAYIRRMFSQDFLLRRIMVRGEVSNCKYHTSGHIYFTLKDASGTLSCIMFAGRRRGLSFPMKEGDQVIVSGSVDVYERGGSYQLYADQIIRDGIGLLNEKYEMLKKKLEEMGMFDEQYKQPIPRYVKRLGVVTAPTGAAVRDIINIATRRNPGVQIILFPAIVQGDEAPRSIISGIWALDHMRFDRDGKYLGVLPEDRERDEEISLSGIDVIIIGRGGGSLEDLWAFNEEAVAQAVFECTTPIISAVGHETDTVITDYVADLRAPTPSAAAELAVFELQRFEDDLLGMRDALDRRMNKKLTSCRETAGRYYRELRLLSPAQQVRERRLHADRLSEKLQAAMDRTLRDWHMRLIDAEDLTKIMLNKTELYRHRLAIAAAKLEQHSPVLKLSGGYGFISDADGRAVTSVKTVKNNDLLAICVRDGRMDVRVEKVEDLVLYGSTGNEQG